MVLGIDGEMHIIEPDFLRECSFGRNDIKNDSQMGFWSFFIELAEIDIK